MKLLIISCCIALLATVSGVAQTSPRTEKEIRKAIIDKFEGDLEFKSVEVHQNPRDHDIFAVLWDDGFWFKCLRVIKFDNGAIVWAVDLDPKYEWGDHQILKAEWKTLDGIGITALEVYTSSHMGNGSYQLLQLNGQSLDCLLSTRSIGRYVYTQTTRNDPNIWSAEAKRTARIVKPRNSRYEEILVAGSVIFFAEDDKTVVREKPLRQLFKWKPSIARFEEEIDERAGSPKFLSID